jgi:hypothetical protein
MRRLSGFRGRGAAVRGMSGVGSAQLWCSVRVQHRGRCEAASRARLWAIATAYRCTIRLHGSQPQKAVLAGEGSKPTESAARSRLHHQVRE